jgi:hypothetical protein
MQESDPIFTRQVQSIPGPDGADIQCLRTEAQIICRAGGRGEVEDIVDRARIERLANVLLYQGESGIVAQTRQVGAASGSKVVHAHHMATLGNKCVAQMRAEEAGGAGDQDTLSRQNAVSPCLKHVYYYFARIRFVECAVHPNRKMLQSRSQLCGQRLVDADSTDVCWEGLPTLR